jgi:exo-beta-1,3-glucanase (GH17 family)
MDVSNGGHHRSRRSTDERPTREVTIPWRGGGKNVVLIRAGDEDWKAQTGMVYE